MRQSRKEMKLERMGREANLPERREAAAFPEADRTEFSGGWEDGAPGGFRNGRRHPPGGRG